MSILNLFKPKQVPDTELEKEFLLFHKILSVLRNTGMSTSRTGSIAGGYTPIYEYNLVTGFLPFATLGAILNEAEIVNPKTNDIFYLSKTKVKEEDVVERNYTWKQISKAVDTLNATKEVEKRTSGQGLFGVDSKTIHLTNEGWYSFNTQKYLSVYEEHKNRIILHRSTINTNLWMKIFTGFVAAATVISVFIGVCNMPDKQYNKEVLKALQQISKSKEVPLTHTYKNLPVAKSATDSIAQKK